MKGNSEPVRYAEYRPARTGPASTAGCTIVAPGLRREDGWVYRMAGSVGEIEARKQLEFALRDSVEVGGAEQPFQKPVQSPT